MFNVGRKGLEKFARIAPGVTKKSFDLTRQASKAIGETSIQQDAEQNALKQQVMESSVSLKQENVLSHQMQKSIEYAHKTIFWKRPSRAFSTNDGEASFVSGDQRQQEPTKDIRPPREVMDNFKERQRETWMKVLGRDASLHGRTVTEKDYKEFCEGLTRIVSNHLAGAKICRRMDAHDLLEALYDGYFQSAHQYQQDGYENYAIRQRLESMADLQWALCGYDRRGTFAGERPIYAIATHDPYGEFNKEALDKYGHVALFFDDGVKRFSTVIGNDSIALAYWAQDMDRLSHSMQIRAIPEPLEKPTYNIVPLLVDDKDISGSKDCSGSSVFVEWDPRDYREDASKMPIRYFEVQIHRKLIGESLGPKHVCTAVIGDPERLEKEMTLKLKSKLDKYGITCDVGKSKEDSQRLRREVGWIRDAFG